jgi:hypothetical protein
MTTETQTTHLHDVGFTISVGEVPAHLVQAVINELREKLEAISEDWMKDEWDSRRVELLAPYRPNAQLTYNGAAECGEH